MDAEKSNYKIWNFHVFFDAHIHKRRDGAGNGWQSVDPTHQERSVEGPNVAPFNKGGFMMGPVSLDRLSAGDAAAKYDAAFQRAATNCVLVQHHKALGATSYVKSVSVNRDKVGKYIISKLPDAICTTEAQSSGVYTKLCEVNVSNLYSKPGSFLALVQDALNEDDSLPLKVSVNAVGVEGKALPYGHNLKFSLSPATGATITGDLKWSVALTAVQGPTDEKSYRKFLTAASGTFSPSEGGAMEFVWDAAMWQKAEVREALAKTFDIEVIFNAEQINGSNKGKTFFTRDVVSIQAPKVEIDCGQITAAAVGQTISCNAAVLDPLRILTLTGVKINFGVTGQEKDLAPVAFEDAVPVVNEEGNKFVYKDLQFTLTSAASSQVGVIATIDANELPPISGTKLLNISGDSQMRFGRRASRRQL